MGAWRECDRLGRWLLAVSLGAVSGCMSCFNPVASPTKECISTCHALPRMQRGHVYVFFMNGLDPVNACNLTGIRDYIQKVGFTKTYYGQLFHESWFAAEIRKISQADANARFVLVGSQLGANFVCDLARTVRCDGITIDLAIFMDAMLLDCEPHNRPDNVVRILNVRSAAALCRGKDYPDAENVCLNDASFLGCGSHPEVLERLTLELAALAASVPIEVSEDPETTPEEAPMPRPAEQPMPLLSSASRER